MSSRHDPLSTVEQVEEFIGQFLPEEATRVKCLSAFADSIDRLHSHGPSKFPDNEHERNWPPIRDLHFAFLDRVARKYADLGTASQKKHQPALLAYLRTFLKRSIPEPVYPSSVTADNGSTYSSNSEPAVSLLGRAAREFDELGEFDTSNPEDARRRVLASIVRRQGQPAFRRLLLEIYDGACAFSGCTVPEILDAAHIMPYKGMATNHPQNGLLLRTDLHTLFDIHLLTVDTADMTIIVAPSLQATEYALLSGKKVRLPTDPAFAPSARALDEHRRTFRVVHSKGSKYRTARRQRRDALP